VGTATLTTYGRAHRGNPLVADGLLALLVTTHAVAGLVNQASAPQIAFLSVGTLALIWRRRAPLLVLAISGSVCLLFEALGYAAPPLPFAPLVALYTVAATYVPAISVTASTALGAGVVTAAFAEAGPLDDDLFFDYLLSVAAAWMLGYGVLLSRARTSLLEEQAMALEREQVTQTRQAVEKEQARIARELHDIVAHHVSVMVAQAGATRRVFDAEPEQARQALGSIEVLGREALTEMRRLLGVLRTDENGAERAPQPGLDQLPALVAQIQRAGLPVRLIVEGAPRPLPAGVELSAFRIVQEALTNTLKHAGPAQATVVLGYQAHILELRIRDNGRGGMLNPTPGHGLVGMRQRAALLAGEVTAGPGRTGGFQVTARLPIDGALAGDERSPSTGEAGTSASEVGS
jgi:signal transduction histidine kinase